MFYRFSLPPAGLKANVFTGIWCQGCSGCYQDRFSQPSPERKGQAVGSQLPGSALSNEHQGAELLISPPRHMAGWSNGPLIQLLLARRVWKQGKGWRATPRAQEPSSSRVSEVLLCPGAAPQSDIPWQPRPLSHHGAGSATEALAQGWQNKQPALGCSREPKHSPVLMLAKHKLSLLNLAQKFAQLCALSCGNTQQKSGERKFLSLPLTHTHPSKGIPQALLLHKKIQVPKFQRIHS